MKKILMLALGLLAGGSVGASGQEVTIEGVEMRLIATASTTYKPVVYVTFVTRNNTSRTIVAWRANLQISNPFGDVIWESPIPIVFGGEGDLPPNGSSREEIRLHDGWKIGFSYSDYQVKDLDFRWSGLRVAYGNAR